MDKAALAARVDLRSVEVGSVPDGVYEGSYTIRPPFPVMAANKSVSVRVTVAGGKYADIQVVAPAQLTNSSWVRGLVSRIKDSRKLSVDAISSGTVTSMAILKAVQLAVGRAGASQ